MPEPMTIASQGPAFSSFPQGRVSRFVTRADLVSLGSVPKQESILIAAATALDAELVRFEEATNGFRKVTLNSQKNLERATKLLTDLAGSEAGLGEKVQALVGAIGTVRDRQMAQVELVREKANEINARTAVFQGLLDEFKQLGTDASGVNDKLQVATSGNPLVDLHGEMGSLAAKAQTLAELAKEKDFEDLSRQADGLRQQILSARSKLTQMQPDLPS